MKAAIIRQTVEIHETEEGAWRLLGHRGDWSWRATEATAAEALRHVTERDRIEAEATAGAVISIIEWHPISMVGGRVVRALAAAPKKKAGSR